MRYEGELGGDNDGFEGRGNGRQVVGSRDAQDRMMALLRADLSAGSVLKLDEVPIGAIIEIVLGGMSTYFELVRGDVSPGRFVLVRNGGLRGKIGKLFLEAADVSTHVKGLIEERLRVGQKLVFVGLGQLKYLKYPPFRRHLGRIERMALFDPGVLPDELAYEADVFGEDNTDPPPVGDIAVIPDKDSCRLAERVRALLGEFGF